MPTDQKKSPDHAKKSHDGILNAVALLALPWLKFQDKMLEFMKAGIKNADTIKPFKELAQHELHALMMILDPERKLRNSAGTDLEKKLEDIYNDTVAKIASGSIGFIEGQQKFIAALIEAANKGRTQAGSKRDSR